MSGRARPLMAPDRVRMYLSLVPYLAERGAVSVAEAAEDFGVTPAQMRKAVRNLTVIGLPRQGPDDLFDISWDLFEQDDVIELTQTVALHRAPRLTAREAAALLSGVRLLQAVPGVDAGGAARSLIEKLSRGTSAAPADVIVAPAAADAVRRIVAEAITAHRAVAFSYRAPDAEPTTRTVDPIKVHVTSGEWYLQGWCHLRRAMRTFHLERVSDATVTDIPVTHAADQVPELFSAGAGEAGVQVTAEYAPELAPLLGDYLKGAHVVESANSARAVISVPDPGSLKRLAARRAGAVRIVEPAAAREAVAEWARRGLEQYG